MCFWNEDHEAVLVVSRLYHYRWSWVCQAFSDYQMQQMTSNFIEQFGFNDEEFADQDDVVEWVLILHDFSFPCRGGARVLLGCFAPAGRARRKRFWKSVTNFPSVWLDLRPETGPDGFGVLLTPEELFYIKSVISTHNKGVRSSIRV